MQEHRVKTVIQPNGVVHLEDLPFKQGEKVENIIIEAAEEPKTENPYPLRGSDYHYENPFEPIVPSEDWEALK